MATTEQIQKLADLTYLSQNTGVATSTINAAYEEAGLDPNDYMAAIDLLEANGYNPGSNTDFYGNNQANDAGAQLLYQRWQEAPTEEELAEAGLENMTVINSNQANSEWLTNALAENNIDTNQTSAITGGVADYSYLDDRLKDNSFWGSKISEYGSYDNATLDMMEWEEFKKKTKKPVVDTTDTSTTGTATVTGGNVNIPDGGQITGGDTSTYTGPQYTSTPNLGVVTPTYGDGQTGLTEVNIPTYEAGLGLQQTQFENRATEQAKLYQPQTLAEQQAAGTAPAFENVLYRNRFGMSMYIQHINGIPSQPIPPGYYKVQGFGTEAQTQAGSAAQTAQGQNQGGVIQGFAPGGTVNPAFNFQPGGEVVQQGNVFKIKYPDGTFSQGYDTAMNAKAALDMGTANLGLPDYTTYLQQQGYDQNLPGFDNDMIYGAYQSYISDPSTLANIQQQAADQAAADAAANTDPLTGTVNQDFMTGQQTVTGEDLAQYQRNLTAQAYVAPGGAVAASPTAYIDPNTYGSVIESTAGQALGTAPMVQEDQVAQIGSATTADTPQKIGASQVTAQQAYGDVQQATADMTAAQLTGPTTTIDAAQQTGTSVSGLTGATGESVDVTGAPTRTLQTGPQGELITGTGVDQAQVGAAFGAGEVQAASVQAELANLMQQFEGGETPAWAAGSMRAASQMLAARGLGASSLAGQAVIQAAMESALPIAQIDTANKQQMALFKAEQRAKFLQMDFDQAFQAKVQNAARVSEIANMNFTAEQQIALENSKAANTMALQNLTNQQAMVMAEAAALSQMDISNLNNRQQAAVQNAQNFLQVDMANLSNAQQTALFKQQSLVNSILSDQAAANAAQQFNATSENQTNQFFANLAASVNQFNAAQINAMKQFNADEVNTLLEFNAGLQDVRERFNAQNYLAVAQANAQWRQNLATINTAAANESNMEYTRTVNGLTMTALDEIWQRERDILSMAFQMSENNANRANAVVLEKLAAEAARDAAELEAEVQAASNTGNFMKEVFLSIVGIG